MNSAASLNTVKMTALSRYADGGCNASVTDSSGLTRGYAMVRQNLPFAIPAIQHDAKTGQGNGAIVRFSVKRASGPPVSFSCWVPNTESPTDLISAMHASKNGRWSSLFRLLPHATVIPDSAHRQPLSNEVRSFAAVTLAPHLTPVSVSNRLRPNFDDECHDAQGDFEWYSNADGTWLIIDVDIDVCDDSGGDIFGYVIDNGYDEPPHVVVDATGYLVKPLLDSVTFTAEVVSRTHLPPVGWKWAPGNGTANDPWTRACIGTGTTCRIPLHGSGTMTYSVLDTEGDSIQGSVIVYIAPFANVDSLNDNGGPGDQDPVDSLDYLASVGLKSSQHLASREEPQMDSRSAMYGPFSEDVVWAPPSTEISSLQSFGIWVNARVDGEWTYTWGGDLRKQCCSTHLNEPSRNLNGPAGSYRGDCTDLVYVAVKQELGPSGWSHLKMSTGMFDTASTATLASYGYERISDSTQVRAGDVAIKMYIGGGGHAGIFLDWEDGWRPIVLSNNGHPANPTFEIPLVHDTVNVDNLTTYGDFAALAGKSLSPKFFRPILP